MNLFFETQVASPLFTVKAGFNEELFRALKPPFVSLKVERFDGCKKGDEVHLMLGTPGFLQKWVSHITSSEAHRIELPAHPIRHTGTRPASGSTVPMVGEHTAAIREEFGS